MQRLACTGCSLVSGCPPALDRQMSTHRKPSVRVLAERVLSLLQSAVPLVRRLPHCEHQRLCRPFWPFLPHVPLCLSCTTDAGRKQATHYLDDSISMDAEVFREDETLQRLDSCWRTRCMERNAECNRNCWRRHRAVSPSSLRPSTAADCDSVSCRPITVTCDRSDVCTRLRRRRHFVLLYSTLLYCAPSVQNLLASHKDLASHWGKG